MPIENGKLFDYCFWINWDQSMSIDNWEKIKEWCNESCAGQWMIIAGSAIGGGYDRGYVIINSYSRASHTAPIPNEKYSAAYIRKTAANILMFEKQEDAIAFKLRWVE